MVNNFSKILRQRRKSQGYSIRNFAEKLDISYGFLSEIERGDKLPAPERLWDMAELYQINEFKLKYLYSEEILNKITKELSSKLNINIHFNIKVVDKEENLNERRI